LDRLLLLETPPVFGGDLDELLRQDDWPVLRLEGNGKLNDPETVAWVAARGPDLIVVCGAGLLRKEILAVPRIGVLNLHGGLVQFYRGLFTTDWAVYNGEPECIGATVHFVTLGIDDGGVVFQARPRLEITDNPSKCYEKVVGLGVQMMTAAIQLIDRDQAPEPVTPERGRLCRARDFTPATKRRLWRRWEDVMPEYVGDREPRDTRVESRLVNRFVPDQVDDFVDGES
jgi:methionyl-tRNA formyltransferase